MIFKSHGYLQIKDGNIRIIVKRDLIEYYKRLIDYHYNYTIKLNTPRHGAHITIINSKIHKNVDISKVLVYNGGKIEFEYDCEDIRIGGRGFINFWFPVKCDFAQKIKEILSIKDNKTFLGLHLTIGNNKNEKTK